MRKIYSFLLALFAVCGLASAEVITVTPTAESGSQDVISFSSAKEGGTTAPTYNAGGQDVRIYAKGTLTVSCSSGNMTQILFYISTQGKKRLAPITASSGTIATQSVGDETVTWTGDANEVVFTVGEKAEYGSDGNTKAGQFDFSSFEVTVGAADPTSVAAPRITPATGTYYSAQEVTITAGNGLKIYYTVDGTSPTDAAGMVNMETALAYSAPFTVTETTTVKAVAVNDDPTLPAPAVSKVAESVITIESAVSYPSIPRMKADAQNFGTEKRPCEMNTNGLTVIAVKGTNNLYVVDYTGEGILLYGDNTMNLVVGDMIGGTISGVLQLYNGTVELGSVDFSRMTLNQQNVVVEPTAATIAELTGDNHLTYESGLVKVSGVKFGATSLSSKNITAKDENGAEITVRDNFGVLADYPFSTSATYDIVAVPTNYNGTIQLYPRTADDIIKVSDGIPDTPHQLVGDGTLANPYTVEDINSMEIPYTTDEAGKKTYGNANGDAKVWVKAQIIGFANGAFNANKVVFGVTEALASNIVIIDEANVTVTAAPELKYCAPVALANSNSTDKAIRAALNLADNPNLLTQTVWLYGDITMYFNANGLKNLEKYSFDGQTILPAGDDPGPGPQPSIDWTSSEDAPLNVATVMDKAQGLAGGQQSDVDVYVEGTITQIDEISTQHGNATYYIADEAGATVALMVYRGKGLGGADFTSESDLAVGKELIVVGKVKNYVKDEVSTIELVDSKIVFMEGGDIPGPEPDYTAAGTGTLADPYNVDAIRSMDLETSDQNEVWVKAVIFGCIDGQGFKSESFVTNPNSESTKSNIVIIDASHNEPTAMPALKFFAPVQLPTGDIRNALNVADNPNLVGQTVWLCGDALKYFGVMGLKNVKKYSFDGETVLPGGDEPGPEVPVETSTIAALRAGEPGAAQIEGTVMVVYNSGFLVQDATGVMTVYVGATPEIAVGDVVTVKGKTTVYGGLLQFDKADLSITKTGTSAVNYPDATQLDGETLDALAAAPEMKYVTVKGALTISGRYKNVTVEGATTMGSIQAFDSVLGNAADGDVVSVTGYFAYVTTSNGVNYANIIATEVTVDGSVEPQPIQTYANIPEMRAAAHELGTTKQACEMNTNGLTVIGVKNKNVYVVDYTNEGGMLLFGDNTLNLQVGQTIGGTIKGKLQLYNGVAELGDVDYSNMSVLDISLPVEPVEATIADVLSNTVKYESGLVVIKGVNFGEATAFEKNTTAFDESDNEIVVRDNYDTYTGQAIEVGADYDVTAIVTVYNEVAQLYPRSIDDIVKVGDADLETPVSEWSTTNIFCAVGDDLYETYQVRFTTNSDGAVTYTSDNEEVATVDADGHITPVGVGKAIITATTAASETFRSSSATVGVIVSGAVATVDEVLSTWDGETKQSDVVVRGFIVGYISGKNLSSAVFFRDPQNEVKSAAASRAADAEVEVSNTNLLLATDKEETDVNKCIPVQLPAGEVREALNLRDNEELALAEVELYGDVEKYFGVCGLKSVSAFKILSIEDAIRAIAADDVKTTVIYTIDGRRVNAITRPGLYIIGGRKVVVK